MYSNEEEETPQKKKMRYEEKRFSIDELEGKLHTARRISNGELVVTMRSNPFSVRVIDELLHDLYDVRNPPFDDELEPERIRLIVDILWEVVRCQNRPPVGTKSRNHPDDLKYPTISLVTTRCRFFAALCCVAESPKTPLETQVTILNLFTVCSNCAPARERLLYTAEMPRLVNKLLSPPFTPIPTRFELGSGNKAYRELHRDLAVLRCLAACRDSLHLLENKDFVRILGTLVAQPSRWTASFDVFQYLVAFLLCCVSDWKHTLLTFYPILRLVIDHSLNPSTQSAHPLAKFPVLELVRALVIQPGTIFTQTLLLHTRSVQLIQEVLVDSKFSNEASLVSAAIAVTNIGCDLVHLNLPTEHQQTLAALCPILLRLAHSSHSEPVRVECCQALTLLVHVLNLYATRDSSHAESWRDLVDWEELSQCMFDHLKPFTVDSLLGGDEHTRNVALFIISTMHAAVTRLGSRGWIRPSADEWIQRLADFSESHASPSTVSDSVSMSVPTLGAIHSAAFALKSLLTPFLDAESLL